MKTGIALALAWPETYCKQAGAWYDPLLKSLNINRGHYYQAGHADLILIQKHSSEIHYYDFGRYHAPFGKGRVRSAKTDPDLTLPLLAIWNKKGKLLNQKDILKALNSNPAYHGDGILYASQFEIDFDKAQNKALSMQSQSPIPYGPFTFGGSNCSRFVNQVLRSSKPEFISWLRLNLPWTLTPSPMSNVRSGGKIDQHGIKSEKGVPSACQIKSTIAIPPVPEFLRGKAYWLSGEGAGSWFTIERFLGDYLIHRYTPDGQVEFAGIYEVETNDKKIQLKKPLRFEHLSHFQSISISQDGRNFRLRLQDATSTKAISHGRGSSGTSSYSRS